MLVNTDISNKQLSEKIGVSLNTVYNWLHNDDFLLELEKEQRRVFGTMTAKAQRKLYELLDSPNPSVALGACRDVLDRGGFKPVEKIEQTTTTIIVDVDD